MKNLILIFYLIFTGNILFAQTQNHEAAIQNFQLNYNSENYEVIFNSFSPKMKEALPLTTMTAFLKELKTQAGTIETTKFIKFHKETYALFKTKFKNAVLAINISLNDSNKINGLYIERFHEITNEKATEMKKEAINSLIKYPKGIADNIFKYCKDFPNNTQLSIAIIKNGETNYYGILKSNDSIKVIQNENKVFEIGSITKVFTATVLAALVEEKKLKLKNNINSFYSFSFKNNIKITFESLANHTSGLPRLPNNFKISDTANPYKDYDEKKLNHYLKKELKLEHKALEQYTYSNLGAGLLGYTLGLSQKTSFQKLLQSMVFDKYGMHHSFTSAHGLKEELVMGLNENGKHTSNWDFQSLFGAGGILSTTSDLAKFAIAQFDPNNIALTLTTTPTFSIDDKMDIGLGWHILKSDNDVQEVWHNGGTAGYSSSMIINKNEKSAVIILSNVSGFHPKNGNIDLLSFALIE
ncbi:MAG TPA: serine hydrolase [Edaphocola sp.]|nr:serine hydrolase [Edaphocola sp.]